MGYLSHKVDRSEIKTGDHIYTWRAAYTYSHHGIYVGENKVVHFTAPEDGWNLSSCFQSSCSNLSASGLNSFNSGFSHSKSEQKWISGSGFPSNYANLSSSCSKSSDFRYSLPKNGQSKTFGFGSAFQSSYTRLSSSCYKSLKCDVSQPKSGDSSSSCLSVHLCGFHQPGSGVMLSCLNCFVGTGSLYLFQYGVGKCLYISKIRGGTCTMAKSDPLEEVIHRAKYLLQHGFGRHDMACNNCEDFALYCKTGRLINIKAMAKAITGGSGQVNYMVSMKDMPVNIFLSATFEKIVSSSIPIGAVAVAVGTHCRNRYKTDIGVRDDVVKVKVEDVKLFRGC